VCNICSGVPPFQFLFSLSIYGCLLPSRIETL
jgi:hypothetical protein